ncbi:MAG: T9SS type A sorting domain-containing protein [Bacteroidales bacterium]|nr:T9SS type A sorting domain-containing protein [Bacteroidales bacterium]
MKAFWLITMTEVFLLLCTNGMQAQETVAVSGGSVTGSGGTVSYTVGQVAYSANTSTTGTITQGVQQPYEIFIVTSMEENEGIRLEMVVYPNPASHYVKLKIEDYKPENLTYQLYDVNGSLLQNGEIINNETVIPTGDLVPAEYYLKVTDSHNELIIFKIIKN